MRIVEVGPHYTPIYEYSPVIRDRIRTGSSYIGTCPSNKWIDYTIEKIKGVGGEFIEGMIQKLPLESDSADEIWVMDVFGSWYFKYDVKKTQDGFVCSREEDFHKAFHELARVLKPRGKIIIGELLTPHVQILDEDFSHYGLTVEEFFQGNQTVELGTRYGIDPDSITEFDFFHFGLSDTQSKANRERFFLVLTKT